MNRIVKKRNITWLLFILNFLRIFMYILMYLVSKRNLKISCIKCLGIILSWIQIWCKRFEGDRWCDNFYLLTRNYILPANIEGFNHSDCRA